MPRGLLDTNILVYVIASDREKRMRALEVVEGVTFLDPLESDFDLREL
jgi:hypothetical protein